MQTMKGRLNDEGQPIAGQPSKTGYWFDGQPDLVKILSHQPVYTTVNRSQRRRAYLSQGMVSVLPAPYYAGCRGLSADVASQKNSSQDEIRTAGLQAIDGSIPHIVEVPTDLRGLGVLLLQTLQAHIN